MHEAQVALQLPSDLVDAIQAALLPELEDGADGTATAVERNADGLEFRIEADSAGALRAQLHSVLRLVDTAARSVQQDL